jgi:8-amino-3,8-dideoxy-alpha-D-manno-octulosonate transaminase
MEDLKAKSFPQSDDYISRNISCLIKLSWSEKEAKQRAERMAEAIRSVL